MAAGAVVVAAAANMVVVVAPPIVADAIFSIVLPVGFIATPAPFAGVDSGRGTECNRYHNQYYDDDDVDNDDDFQGNGESGGNFSG